MRSNEVRIRADERARWARALLAESEQVRGVWGRSERATLREWADRIERNDPGTE